MNTIQDILKEKAHINLRYNETRQQYTDYRGRTERKNNLMLELLESPSNRSALEHFIVFLQQEFSFSYITIYNDNREPIMLCGSFTDRDIVNINNLQIDLFNVHLCTSTELTDVNRIHPGINSAVKFALGQNNIVYNYILMEHSLEEIQYMDELVQLIKIFNSIYIKNTVLEQISKLVIQSADYINLDPKTKVYSVRALNSDKKHYKGKQCTYAFFDLDKFKNINDTFGHDVGDVVLIRFAALLNKYAKRLTGKAYRYGGEEFLLISSTSFEDSFHELDALRTELSKEEFTTSKGIFSVTVSIGIYCSTISDDVDTCVKKADDNLYKAKHTGRNRICY